MLKNFSLQKRKHTVSLPQVKTYFRSDIDIYVSGHRRVSGVPIVLQSDRLLAHNF